MSTIWPAIPEGDPPDTRVKAEPHHVGLVVSQRRAIAVARALFPDEYKAEPTDCRNFVNKPGEPCPICADNNERWSNRVREVRKAMMEAFK